MKLMVDITTETVVTVVEAGPVTRTGYRVGVCSLVGRRPSPRTKVSTYLPKFSTEVVK